MNRKRRACDNEESTKHNSYTNHPGLISQSLEYITLVFNEFTQPIAAHVGPICVNHTQDSPNYSLIAWSAYCVT